MGNRAIFVPLRNRCIVTGTWTLRQQWFFTWEQNVLARRLLVDCRFYYLGGGNGHIFFLISTPDPKLSVSR